MLLVQPLFHLKMQLIAFFSRYGLSISRLRGQGYDGVSNMQVEFNGLKTLILKENLDAFYIHCFAHQLQLALAAIAKKYIQVASLILAIASVINIVGASAKRWARLHQLQATKIIEALDSGEISSGRGLHQETMLKCTSDTRWSSHYDSLISLLIMFSATIDLLEIIADERPSSEQKFEANNLLGMIQSFDFVFTLHLMKAILGITNELSKALQRRDQDIVNAMVLEKICKHRLQMMRDEGWQIFYDEVSSFCEKNKIDVPNMDDIFIARGRSKRKVEEVTNLHHFRVELFYSAIDMQLQELNDRFTEGNTELLCCVAYLCPNGSFSAYDKQKLICLAQFYPKDFSLAELLKLKDQLETYILDVCSNEEFVRLKGLGDLAKKMVETKKDEVYPLVFLLIRLALVLPVATATVERVFSGMNIMKNRLRNRMGDQLMNDNLIVYVEKDIFDSIDNEVIVQRFQNMKPCRVQL